MGSPDPLRVTGDFYGGAVRAWQHRGALQRDLNIHIQVVKGLSADAGIEYPTQREFTSGSPYACLVLADEFQHHSIPHLRPFPKSSVPRIWQ